MGIDLESRRGFLKAAAVIGTAAALTPTLRALGVDTQAIDVSKPKYVPTPDTAASKKILPVLLKKNEDSSVLRLGAVEVQKTQFVDGTTNGRNKEDVAEALMDVSNLLERYNLGKVVRKVAVIDPNSPKLKPRGYGTSIDEHRMGEALATAYINRDGLEIDFSSGNSPKRVREITTMHEVGHALDSGNPYLKEWLGGGNNGEVVSTLGLRAEQEYRKIFLTYLENSPVFDYEGAVVASKSLDVGEKMWPVFVAKANGVLPFIEGSTFVIPETRIAEAAKRYSDGSVFSNLLLRRARIGTPNVIKNFSAKDLGLGLVMDAIDDLSSIDRDLGEETASGLKELAEETIKYAFKERYADLFALQITDQQRAHSIAPVAFEMQQFVVRKLGMGPLGV